MPKCRNRSCTSAHGKRATIPKGVFPPFCGDDCKEAWVKQVIAESDRRAARAIKKAQNTKAREEKAKRAEFRAKKRDFQARDVGRQLSLTQAAVNKLCKLLDRGKPCICCGRPEAIGKGWHAGHFKSRGSNSAMRFSLLNLHACCWVCNAHLSGNIDGYRQGLAERYGSAITEYLDSAPRLRAWEPAELIQMRQEVNAEIKRIEKGLPPSKDWRAIPEQQEQNAA